MLSFFFFEIATFVVFVSRTTCSWKRWNTGISMASQMRLGTWCRTPQPLCCTGVLIQLRQWVNKYSLPCLPNDMTRKLSTVSTRGSIPSARSTWKTWRGCPLGYESTKCRGGITSRGHRPPMHNREHVKMRLGSNGRSSGRRPLCLGGIWGELSLCKTLYIVTFVGIQQICMLITIKG